ALDSNADTTHTYTVAGTYGAVLTVTDAEGLTDTMTITVTVNGENTNCAGVITAMYVIEGILGQGETEIIVPVGGSLLLTTVQRTPFSITTPSGEVIADNINIKFFDLEDVGTYFFTSENGCTYTLFVDIDLNGVLTADNDFSTIILFPNPIESQNVGINLNNFLGESMTVGIYDISGKLLQQYLIPENHDATVILDLPLLNTGIYHVVIGLDSTGDVVLRKLLKR
ncbi:T9SS type A sorting domain-containing protein, partial [Maribacter sp. CXY002]|uniref:T9SS type A sorting domain-containing protein n=1 Tax=Maribacter luteocoastalis TaxID=3407671 RepID=UPI003B67C139